MKTIQKSRTKTNNHIIIKTSPPHSLIHVKPHLAIVSKASPLILMTLNKKVLSKILLYQGTCRLNNLPTNFQTILQESSIVKKHSIQLFRQATQKESIV